MSTKGLLCKQPFYKESIKKARVEKLNNNELLRELPFSDDINISRKKRAYKKYAETYEAEIINGKSLSDSMSMSENSIKNLFDDLLGEKRGFNYALSNKIILKKRINDNEHKYYTVYFNSLIKMVINHKLKISFK